MKRNLKSIGAEVLVFQIRYLHLSGVLPLKAAGNPTEANLYGITVICLSHCLPENSYTQNNKRYVAYKPILPCSVVSTDLNVALNPVFIVWLFDEWK